VGQGALHPEARRPPSLSNHLDPSLYRQEGPERDLQDSWEEDELWSQTA
jgi:hypothetical protein